MIKRLLALLILICIYEPNASFSYVQYIYSLFFSVYGVVAELCTGQKKISLEPYEGTGIIYPENYPSIKGYEECVQLLLKSF